MTSFAFIFPGQGSQSVGMLAGAHEAWPEIGSTFAEASDALGFDLWDMACNGPAETLSLTANTQPLILSASVALFRVWRAQGGAMPSVAAGHSLGEFSALVAAESLNFADAVKLVRLRGQAMQQAVPVGEGAMAAIIGLEDDVINTVCEQVSAANDGVVMAVNYNSPGQCVIAGHTAAVEAAIAALKEAGAKRALPLPVSAPFHTPLMSPVGDVLAEALANMKVADPVVPVISNVDAQAKSSGEEIAKLLIWQVSAPVQWTGCVATMTSMGCADFVECGPGKVLSGLVKRINKASTCFSIETPDALDSTLASVCYPASVC